MLKRKKAQTLIEILVAIGLAAVILPGLLTGFVASREGKAQESQRLQAVALLREAEEALRSTREGSWTNIETNGTYYPAISGNAWTLTSGTETIGEFTREIIIADVERDSNGAIVASGGTVDPSTKSAVSTVSWSTPISSSVSSTNYFHRYLSNAAWTQTNQPDFNGGTHNGTETTSNGGGAVELSQGLALTGSYDNSGADNANDVFVSGDYAYLVTDDATNALIILDISTPASPSLSGSFNAGTDVNGIHVSGNYAYLATESNSQELMVVDISNKSSPALAGSLNLATNENAFDVYVAGDYAYVTKDSGGGSDRELFVIDISYYTHFTYFN